MTTVLLADDQIEVRSALRLLLEQELGLKTIHEAADVDTALQCARKRPLDIVIVDWELGDEIAQLVVELRRCACAPKILAMSGRPQAKAEALQLGVDGFISKTETPEILLSVLRSLLSGEAA